MVHRRTRVEKGSRLREGREAARQLLEDISKNSPYRVSHIGVQFQVFTAGSRLAKFTDRPIIIIRGDSAVRGVHQGSRDILPFRLFLHGEREGGGGGWMRGRERRIGPLPSRDIGPASRQPDPKMEGASIASPFTAPISLPSLLPH